MLIKFWLTYDSDTIWIWSHICLKVENILLYFYLKLLKTCVQFIVIWKKKTTVFGSFC